MFFADGRVNALGNLAGDKAAHLKDTSLAHGHVAGGGRLSLILLYMLATLLAFPILETTLRGVDARHNGLDVIDDGSVTRPGGWPHRFSARGPALWNPLLTAGNATFAPFAGTPLALGSLVALVLPPFLTYVLFAPAAIGLCATGFLFFQSYNRERQKA